MAIPMAAFQQPSTEKAFAEYLTQHITQLDARAPGSQDFLEAFQKVYGVHLEWDQIREIIRGIKSPKHRLLVVRPVLNKMLRGQTNYPEADLWLPLVGQNQLLTIAKAFNLSVELENITAKNIAGQRINPFQTFNASDLLEEIDLNNQTFKKLKENIATTIFKTPPEQVPNLNPTLRAFELENRPKQEVGGTFGTIQKALEKLPTLLNPLGIKGPDRIFNLISQLLSKLLVSFSSAFSSFIALFKSANTLHKKEDAPLDDQDIQADPTIAEEASQFATLSHQLSAFGGEKGKQVTAELNKKWRINPNAPEIWEELMDALLEQGLLEEANKWLLKREKRLFMEVTSIIDKLKKEMPVALEQETLQVLEDYKEKLNRLEDPILSHASKAYKVENFNLRLKMLKNCSGTVNKIRAKYQTQLEAALRFKEMEQIKKNVELQSQHAGNTEIGQILQGRLDKIAQELSQLDRTVVKAQQDTTAELDLIKKVHPGLITLFKDHQERLIKAKKEAERQEKRFEERSGIVQSLA